MLDQNKTAMYNSCYAKKALFSLLILLMALQYSHAQQIEKKERITVFSGSLGITNNGFSIIPTFSLNSPAAIVLLSWKRNRFSINPEIRLTPDAKKGSMLLWFRYRLIEKKKFSLRVGIHPAFNFQLREIIQNGDTTKITQMRRFIASELVPNYNITPNWSIGMYYLQGNGLQKDGARTSHFLTFNTNIANIKMGDNFKLQFSPAVYYLYLDGKEGNYFTATATLSHKKFPINFQSAINKTLTSNIPGNKDFLWNVSLNYVFSKKLTVVK